MLDKSPLDILVPKVAIGSLNSIIIAGVGTLGFLGVPNKSSIISGERFKYTKSFPWALALKVEAKENTPKALLPATALIYLVRWYTSDRIVIGKEEPVLAF